MEKLWHKFYPEEESIQECHDRRLMTAPLLSPAEREVLRQLREVVWDGFLSSKCARNSLVERGLAVRYNGYQVASREGLALLEILGELREYEKQRSQRKMRNE